MLFEAHPAASIFPMLDHDAFERLKEDIRIHGQRDMIVFLGDKIIDGRNRYKACIELGIEPNTCELDSCDDPIGYVLSTNLHRRQLRTSQRAMCAARMAMLPAHRPDNSLNCGSYSAEQAAHLFGVSEATIERARKVNREGCAELIALCDDDGESVATACNFIDACENKREQAKIAKQGWEAIREKAKDKPKPASKAKEEPTTSKKEPTSELRPMAVSSPAEEVDAEPEPEDETSADSHGYEPNCGYRCPNCGCTEFDEDGDCSACHEPAAPVAKPKKSNPVESNIIEGFRESIVYVLNGIDRQSPYVRLAVAEYLREMADRITTG
jgi:hypothetical protein